MDILAALAGGPAPAGQGRPARPAGSAGPDGAGGTGDGAAQTRGFAQDLAALSGEPDGAEGREKGAPDMPTGREMAGEDAVDAQDAALPDTSRKSIAEGGAPALPGPASAPIPEMVRATADAHGPAVRVAVPAVSTPPAGTGGESAAGVAPPAAREVGPGGAGRPIHPGRVESSNGSSPHAVPTPEPTVDRVSSRREPERPDPGPPP